MKLLLIVAGAGLLLWLLMRLLRRRREPPAVVPSITPPVRRREEVELRVLDLPPELAAAITDAIRQGKDPDDVALPATLHAHDLRVVGESFANPNGSSRQAIIEAASVACPVYLVPEPDNVHDPNAIKVYVPGKGTADQIGYLPRGYDDIVTEVKEGHVAAWLKSKQRAGNGLWGATLYLVRREADR